MNSSANRPPGRPSRILAALDLSSASSEILEAAVNLGPRAPIELHVVHVLPLPPIDNVGVPQADRRLHLADVVEGAHEELRRAAVNVTASVSTLVLHVRAGSADHEIAQLASDIGADLLVVGTHERSPLGRLILGSVAASLVRHAPCPVLVYRSKAIPIWEKIAPACADCLTTQGETGRAKLWCERHSQRHPRAHTYSEIPPSFAVGSQTFR